MGSRILKITGEDEYLQGMAAGEENGLEKGQLNMLTGMVRDKNVFISMLKEDPDQYAVDRD